MVFFLQIIRILEETHSFAKCVVQILTLAVKKLEAANILSVIELVNHKTVPGYYLDNFEKALRLVKKINSPNLKLMLDVFHVQLIRGFVQIAQAPERNEPDTPGEMDYKYVLKLFEDVGYDGYIRLEYVPRAGTIKGLKWIKNFGYNL